MALIVPQTNIATRLAIQKSARRQLDGLTQNGLLYYSEGVFKTLVAATNGQLPIGSTSAAPVLAEITGVANETDVTVGAGTITIGLVNPLIVAKGGTGAATLTDHGILLGSGTGAVTPLGVADDGKIPIGSAGANPVLAEITGTANQITSTPGAGSITLSLSDPLIASGAVTVSGLSINTVAKTTAYTAAATDDVITCGAGNETFTIDLPAPTAGKTFYIKNVGTGVITVDADTTGGTTIDGETTQIISSQYDCMKVISDASAYWII